MTDEEWAAWVGRVAFGYVPLDIKCYTHVKFYEAGGIVPADPAPVKADTATVPDTLREMVEAAK